jgi:hypothetical protein
MSFFRDRSRMATALISTGVSVGIRLVLSLNDIKVS